MRVFCDRDGLFDRNRSVGVFGGFALDDTLDSVDVLASATACFKVGAGAGRILAIVNFVFRWSCAVLGWDDVKSVLFFNPGKGRDFESAMLAEFNAFGDSVRNWFAFVAHDFPLLVMYLLCTYKVQESRRKPFDFGLFIVIISP